MVLEVVRRVEAWSWAAWFLCRAPKPNAKHQGSGAEHQRAVINHQKVDVGVTASTFNFEHHQKSRWYIMKQIRVIASKKHQSIAFWVLML